MKNTNILYGIIGLVLGVAVTYGVMSVATNPAKMSGMDHSMTMSGMMDDMTIGLTGKTGDDFDKTFLEEMIVHHQGAVDMAKMVLSTSKRPELIELANNIIAAQTKEIGMMKSWQKTWFK